MYTIYVDGNLLYSPERADEGYTVTAAKLTREINKADTLDMTIPGSNPGLSSLVMLGSRIVVYQGINIVFIGRALTAKRGLYDLITYHCEGGLAYFNDALYTSNGLDVNNSPKAVFHSLNNAYSSGTYSGVKFRNRYIPNYVPHLQGTGYFWINEMPQDAVDYMPGEYIRNYDVSEFERLLKSIEIFGGSLVVQYLDSFTQEYTNPVPLVQVHWYASGSEPLDTQVLQFGENILDLTHNIDYTGLRTVFFATGIVSHDGFDEDVIIYLPVANACEVPDEGGLVHGTMSIYIPSASLVTQYGFLMDEIQFDLSDQYSGGDIGSIDNITSEYRRLQQILYNKTVSYAASKTEGAVSFQCNAIDLNLVDSTKPPFNIGHRNRIVSEPNGIDTTVLCSRTEIDLLNPSNSRYTFGAPASMMASLLRPNSSLSGNDDVARLVYRFTK